MTFCTAVQSDELDGPLRREFRVGRWTTAFRQRGASEADQSLHDAGLLIHQKANQIRSNLQVTFSTHLSSTTKLRAFTALANYNYSALQRKSQVAVAVAVAKQKAAKGDDSALMISDIATMKLALGIGAAFSPDEIIQSVVDGTQVVVKVLLEGSPALDGNPKFADVNWDHVILDFNLGNLYAHVEDLWDDCLWNDYRVTKEDQGYVFSPADPTWQYRLVASRFRLDNLSMQFTAMAYSFQKELAEAGLLATAGIKDVKAVTSRLLKFARRNPVSQPTGC